MCRYQTVYSLLCTIYLFLVFSSGHDINHLFWTEMGEDRENAEERKNTGILQRQVDQWDMPPQYLEKGKKEYQFFAA